MAHSSAFALSLPRNSVVAPHKSSAGFETDLENLFSADSVPAADGEHSSKDDDWANVDETGEAQSISIRSKEMDAGSDVFPAVETLSRPDILFRSLTPYLLNVTLYSANKLVVQGTHEPSLQLLSDYLQRWMKRDHRDVRKVSSTYSFLLVLPQTHSPHGTANALCNHRIISGTVFYHAPQEQPLTHLPQIPLLRATLGESNFGLGLNCDTLTIEPHDHNQRYVEVNPTIVLAFIEGVLGYRLAHTERGSWEYRREVAFK